VAKERRARRRSGARAARPWRRGWRQSVGAAAGAGVGGGGVVRVPRSGPGAHQCGLAWRGLGAKGTWGPRGAWRAGWAGFGAPARPRKTASPQALADPEVGVRGALQRAGTNEPTTALQRRNSAWRWLVGRDANRIKMEQALGRAIASDVGASPDIGAASGNPWPSRRRHEAGVFRAERLVGQQISGIFDYVVDRHPRTQLPYMAGLIQSLGRGFGFGWRRGNASSSVMSCITVCIPARIDRKPAIRSRLRAARSWFSPVSQQAWL
jgi:hypothetical protein